MVELESGANLLIPELDLLTTEAVAVVLYWAPSMCKAFAGWKEEVYVCVCVYTYNYAHTFKNNHRLYFF